MSIKDVINGACDILSLDRFNTVYTSDDPNAQTMMELAKFGGDEIARRVDWASMLKSATIPSSPFNRPADFQRVIPGGGLYAADGTAVRPSTNGAEWLTIKTVGSIQPYFFVDAAAISISPAAAAIGASLLYVSKNWIKSGAAEKDVFSSDADELLFPERLLEKDIIWRYKRKNGFVYDDELAEFEADLASEIKANRGIA